MPAQARPSASRRSGSSSPTPVRRCTRRPRSSCNSRRNRSWLEPFPRQPASRHTRQRDLDPAATRFARPSSPGDVLGVAPDACIPITRSTLTHRHAPRAALALLLPKALGASRVRSPLCVADQEEGTAIGRRDRPRRCRRADVRPDVQLLAVRPASKTATRSAAPIRLPGVAAQV
jgi:hypothetical protein